MKHHLNRKGVSLDPLIAGGIAMLVYLFTAAPDLTWANFGGDGGELITAAVTLGVPHPPGYPTFVLLGKLFSTLPIGSVAYRFNLFSAVGMAVAVGFITAVYPSILPKKQPPPVRWVSVAGGLTIAFSALVWSQATMTEVYGLNLAVVAALLWSVWRKRPLRLTGFLLGLSLTTHMTSVFLIPLVFFVCSQQKKEEKKRRGLKQINANWVVKLGIGFVLGLLPYLSIFGLARSGSPVNWGGVSGLSSWWWLVSGQAYQGYLFKLSVSHLGERLHTWGWVLLNQFTLLGLPLIWLGLRSLGQKRILWIIVGTAVLYLLYAIQYDTADAIVLILPAILLLSIPLTQALRSVGVAALLLPAALIFINFSSFNLREDMGLREETTVLFESIPHQALTITPGDRTIFALWYFQHVEQQRADIILVDQDLFAFSWYRQQIKANYSTLGGLEKDDLELFQQYNAALRPVCNVTLIEDNKPHIVCHEEVD
jgi:hypothetical protein